VSVMGLTRCYKTTVFFTFISCRIQFISATHRPSKCKFIISIQQYTQVFTDQMHPTNSVKALNKIQSTDLHQSKYTYHPMASFSVNPLNDS